MTDQEPYTRPPYETRALADPDFEESTPALYASPVDDDSMQQALAPVRRRGRRMPGTFKYAPDELWDMFRRYTRDFMPGRQLYRKEMLKGGPMAGTTVEIDMQAPMTLETFCLFCDMAPSTYTGYRKRVDYKDVTDMIDSAIFANNYEMGALGLIHAGLVARKHGMAEHTDVSSGGKTIEVVPIQFSFSRKSLEGQLNKSLDQFDELK